MKKKILFADDQPDLVVTIKMFLEVHGFEVATAYDGEEAYNLAQEDKYDLFLLDVLLPKKMGDDLAAQLKKDPSNANTPVIMLTNLPLEALTGAPGQKAPVQTDSKGNLYVQKNCSEEELLGAINFSLSKPK